VDALDHENAVLDFDLTCRVCDQSSFCGSDLTRFQRASERTGQSTRSGGDDIVERGGVLGLATTVDAVMVGDLVVNTKQDRLSLGRQCRPPQRAAHTLDPHP
jgi:hypothetical protein